MRELLEHPQVRTLMQLSLAEDLGEHGDVTSRVFIPEDARLRGALVARQAGVLAGLPLAIELFGAAGVDCEALLCDGQAFGAGARLLELAGPAREILRLERPVLNFLQRLCGIASKTARYVQALAGSHTQIVDTRKTTPGWRLLEKYAVRQGGGGNHRMHLSALGMVKDNHLQWLARSQPGLSRPELFALLLERWRQKAPAGVRLQVEVDSLADYEHAVRAGCDFILLDNFDDGQLEAAVAFRAGLDEPSSLVLEASGGITIERLPALGRIGVDRVSSGALTHSAIALDIGLDFETEQEDR